MTEQRVIMYKSKIDGMFKEFNETSIREEFKCERYFDDRVKNTIEDFIADHEDSNDICSHTLYELIDYLIGAPKNIWKNSNTTAGKSDD